MYFLSNNLFIYVIPLITIINYGHCKPKEDTYSVPKQIVTEEGSSYTLMLKHDSVTPVKCFIEHRIDENTTQKYSIDLLQQGQSPTPVSLIYKEFNKDQDVITSLGDGICGFKMDAVSNQTVLKWNISFFDKNEDTYYKYVNVIVMRTHPRHIVDYKKVGETFTITCAKEQIIGDAVGDLYYCEVINPQNEKIRWNYGKVHYNRDCVYPVSSSTLSDFGTWKCLQHFQFSMEPTEVIYEVIPIETNIIVVNSSFTSSRLQISCSVVNATRPPYEVDYCLMTRPDGKEILFHPGLATKRYTTIGTDFNNHTCTLQVQLPLLEEEKGLWSCAVVNNYYGPVGGFVNVSRKESKYVPDPDYPSQVKLRVNSTLSAECRIPRSAPYCWFRDPRGVLYSRHEAWNISLGLCYIQKDGIQLLDNGTWFCGFGNQMGASDEVYAFNVSVLDSEPLVPQQAEIISFTTGTAQLGCTTSSVGDYPLEYCRFLSPSGRMYHVDTTGKSSDRISYSGRGLQYGDCTITLRDVAAEDEGTWSCITRLITKQDEELYTNVHLTINDNLSLASTLGIAFGAGFLFIITLGLLIHRFVKRRRYTDVIFNPPINNQQDGHIVFNNLQDNNINSTTLRNYNSPDVGMSSNDLNENLNRMDDTENIVFDLVDDRRHD